MITPRIVIPSIDRLLKDTTVTSLVATYGHTPVVAALRAAAAGIRAQTSAEVLAPDTSSVLIAQATATLAASHALTLVPVFNLTGTVLHTNLGRAALPASAVAALAQVAEAPVNLEYQLATGKRGDRDDHLEHWLTRLTGAEAATVVNNNAAAVMLVLNTFARRRDVLMSRGELVEIGGAFRVPDVMTAAGTRLREVGTTNRIHLRDYVDNIDTRTALIMKIHPSNYRIEGFTAAVPETELAALATARGIPFVVDLGSGTLLDLAQFGLPPEPTVQETIAHGADLVTFSGDKLLGGPQAGIIVGRAPLIARLKKNPMTRALRIDKLTIAALEAVLRLYADPARARVQLPTLRLLTRPLAEIEALAASLLPALRDLLQGFARVNIISCASQIGSGALPVDLLPSCGFALRPLARGSSRAVTFLAARLRALPKPVIGRIHQNALLLDLRCLEDTPGFLAQMSMLAQETAGAI